MSIYGKYTALGYQQIAVDAAQSLSAPSGTEMTLIIPQTQAIRWRGDGTDPTATVGQPLSVGSELQYDAGSINKFRAIGQAAGGVINVVFYGR
jgi:hypothetical protein